MSPDSAGVVRAWNGGHHAVLTVSTDKGGHVLDNLRADVLHWAGPVFSACRIERHTRPATSATDKTIRRINVRDAVIDKRCCRSNKQTDNPKPEPFQKLILARESTVIEF